MRLRAIGALLCAAAALSACEKNAVQTVDGPVAASRVRFYNYGLNAPGVNFYANEQKMTAISSTTGTESTNGVAYGNIVASGLYSAIEPGAYRLTGRIAAATDKDLPISSVNVTIEAGKAYSFYQSGVYNATAKTADAFVVEDPIPAEIDFSGAQVRFVNAIHNSSPMVLYVKSTATADAPEIAIGSAVAYKSAGGFIAIPNGSYDLRVRLPGSTANAIVRTAVGFNRGQVYTISARGDITITSTTATNRPFLDNTANR